ncbi:MFS transporter [Phycicoccus endophyticus]|uniref:MFS transporter n=1 Tax=Phycicoccus endophyticus TaxID=1690220 RepID=A0A7G9R1E9_9MICO|nr:MDR family MFS transporter [Phycicoccus endophyticus]NHI18790.1 MFS transporter [Phycicoccus endophyticus]QNN49424.1 MFS transporter [Phycicoccus endophyticus]GGL36538.1 MFS transporter [Phycicoccus endophyticus]
MTTSHPGDPAQPASRPTTDPTPAPAAAASAPTGGGSLSHRQILTILVGLMMGMFLAALDQTIVATSIRTIADDLHGLDQQAWATTAYLITATIVTPLYGKLGDIYGRKKLFIFAISIFVVGSALSSFAGSMYGLAAFRAVQGMGAGGLMSLALAIIGDIVPPRERAKYQGYFLAVFGTSSVAGPIIGGFFAGADSILGITGWRWVFLVNVPIGLVALVVVSRTLHLSHQRLDHRIDWAGAFLLSAALVPLLIVLEQGREWGWTSTGAWVAYVVSVVAAVAFVWQELRMKEEAILPLEMFRNKTVGVSSTASVIIGIAMFGGLAALPLYLQIVKGSTPTEAGLQLIPLVGGIMTGSIVSGQVIARTGRYRMFPIIGSALLVVGLFGFHFVAYDTPLWQTMIIMVVFGLGLGFNFQPLTLAVQNAVPAQQIGVATSTATTTRQLGGTVGTAVFLSILFSTVPDRIAESFTRLAGTRELQAGVAEGLQAPAGSVDHQVATAIQQAASGDATAAASSGVLSDSSFLSQLDPRLAKPFLVGFSDAMDLVFLVGAGVMVLGLLVMLMLPHVELRGGSAYSERTEQAERAQETATAPAS